MHFSLRLLGVLNKLILLLKMFKVKHEQLLATENEQLQKLNEIVLKAIEEEKLLSDKLPEFEDRNSPFVSRLADKVAGFGGSWKFIISFFLFKAKDAGVKIGLCGQGPSDFPEFATFLVEQGIDSIFFNPDALLKGMENINEAESHLLVKT